MRLKFKAVLFAWIAVLVTSGSSAQASDWWNTYGYWGGSYGSSILNGYQESKPASNDTSSTPSIGSTNNYRDQGAVFDRNLENSYDFGSSWDFTGSEVDTQVGRIENSGGVAVGLVAKQLQNLGVSYSDSVIVTAENGKSIRAAVYNACCGYTADSNAHVVLTKQAVDSLGIGLGSKIHLKVEGQ